MRIVSIVLSFYLSLVSVELSGQFSLKGKLINDNQEVVIFANILLLDNNQTIQKYSSSDDKGFFIISDISPGVYTIKITSVSYHPHVKEITIDNNITLNTIILLQDSKVLDEAIVTEKLPLAKNSEDTLSYNAKAFKVLKDAEAGDLIEKIPGMTSENGRLKSQGENVQQVLVDGKPFFGNDPTLALKNIPAELIDKIQVYDAQSEQSRFTGFQDGNTVKTINIVTTSGAQNGQFGKVYGGYGYKDVYQMGGNVNVFDGNRKLSTIAMSNNINTQNFSNEDILGVFNQSSERGRGSGGPGSRSNSGGRGGPQNTDFFVNTSGGITTTHAIGINFSDKWNKVLDYSISYFGNDGSTDVSKSAFKQYLDAEQTGQNYSELNTASSQNTNHRLHGQIEYSIDSFTSIQTRTRLSYQKNTYSGVSNIQNLIGTQALETIQSDLNNRLSSIYFSNNLTIRHKFFKQGRTISLDWNYLNTPKTGSSDLQTQTKSRHIDSLNQLGELDQTNHVQSANIEYTEPISKALQCLLQYRISKTDDVSRIYNTDFNPLSEKYDIVNEFNSNQSISEIKSHQTGLGLNWSKSRELNANVRVSGQWTDQILQTVFPLSAPSTSSAFHIVPSGSFRYSKNRNTNYRLFYRSYVQSPTIDQLHATINNSNPLSVSSGNPALSHARQHFLSARYQSTIPNKAMVLYVNLSGGFANNYIANASIYAQQATEIQNNYILPAGAQYTYPINLEGYAFGRSFFSIGFPIKSIKSNLSFDVNYSITKTPSLLNQLTYNSISQYAGTGISITSNISDKVDFTLSYRPNYNIINSGTAASSDEFSLNQNARAKLNWIVYEGFVIRTDFNMIHNQGFDAAYNSQYYILNLSIGKKLFKNNRGELAIAVNDLLDQNKNITNTITDIYIENIETNTLNRFFMLSLSYNIRNINKQSKSAN